MPCIDAAVKCAVEKRRRETINAKIIEIKKIISPTTSQQQDVPHHKILAKAAELLTGAYPTAPTPPSAGSSRSSTPVGPGPVKKDRKEYKKDLEAVRRSKEAVAYNALYAYVTEKNLGPRGKLEKSQLLDIVIQEVQKKENAAPSASVPAPTAQPHSFSMQRFLTAPVAPVVSAPLPIVPAMQATIGFAQYLAFYQMFPQFIPIVPMPQNVQVVEKVEDEIIDVVNL